MFHNRCKAWKRLEALNLIKDVADVFQHFLQNGLQAVDTASNTTLFLSLMVPSDLNTKVCCSRRTPEWVYGEGGKFS